MNKKIFISFIILIMSLFIGANTYAKTVTYTHPTFKNPNGGAMVWEWTIENSGEVSSGILKGCAPLPVKLTEYSFCIMCPFYLTLFKSANTISEQSFLKLAEPLKKVMLIAFAIWVAFLILKQLSSFSKVEAPKFIADILTQTFKLIIAYIFLTHSGQVYEFVITPIINAGLDWGGAMLFNTDPSKLSPTAMAPAGLISPTVYAKIDIFTQAIHQELSFLQAIGSSLMCISWNEASTWAFPDGSLLISGFTIYIFALAVTLSFGFYLIDAILQLSLLGMLMPFSLACWPFKISQKWMKVSWDMFLNTFFSFAFMGLVISIVVQLMGQAITGGEAGFQEVINLFSTGSLEDLAKMFEIGFTGFLTLVCCFLFAKKFIKESASLAGTFSGGAISSMGNLLGGLAISAITAPIKRIAGGQMSKVGKAIKSKAGDIGGKIGRRVKGAANNAGKAIANSKAGKAASTAGKKMLGMDK